MDAGEAIEKIQEFLELYYKDELGEISQNNKPNLIIDYLELINFNPEIGGELLDNPEEVLVAFRIAAENITNIIKKTKSFEVRFKNTSRYNTKEINRIRAPDLDKFITIEGVVIQKSPVEQAAITSRFECPSCGAVLSMLQDPTSSKKEPKGCGCGRKGKFRLLSEEIINIHFLGVEEKTEEAVGGIEREKIKVFCQGGLCIPKIERKLFMGCKVKITGQLKKRPLIKQRTTSNIYEKYLDANYIEFLEDDFESMEITTDEKDMFKEISEDNNCINILKESIFYDIVGYDFELTAILLQMFGGDTLIHPTSTNTRGTIHILLIGDAGTAKSTILQVVEKFAPKTTTPVGGGITVAGLLGAIETDEPTGKKGFVAGAIPLGHKGVCLIDELDKIDEDTTNALHGPMTSMEVKITKAVKMNLLAETSILAAANPKYGNYSEYDTVYNQIALKPTFVNRFDFIFPIINTKLSKEQKRKIYQAIIDRGKEKRNKSKYDKDFQIGRAHV